MTLFKYTQDNKMDILQFTCMPVVSIKYIIGKKSNAWLWRLIIPVAVCIYSSTKWTFYNSGYCIYRTTKWTLYMHARSEFIIGKTSMMHGLGD